MASFIIGYEYQLQHVNGRAGSFVRHSFVCCRLQARDFMRRNPDCASIDIFRLGYDGSRERVEFMRAPIRIRSAAAPAVAEADKPGFWALGALTIFACAMLATLRLGGMF